MPECPLVDDAIAHALHQMTAQERESFQAHLTGCVACRLKLAEIAETVDVLPLALPASPPPPGLRDKVMSSIAQEAKVGQAEARRRRLVPLWAAAAAAVALFAGAYSLLEVDRLKASFDGFTRAAPIEQTILMTGTYEAPSASGRMLVSRSGGGTRITVQVHGLQPLQGGQVYQLWLFKDGERTNGGVFVVDGTGKGGLATWLPVDVAFDACGITREPDALGTAPRGIKVMGSDVW